MKFGGKTSNCFQCPLNGSGVKIMAWTEWQTDSRNAIGVPRRRSHQYKHVNSIPEAYMSWQRTVSRVTECVVSGRPTGRRANTRCIAWVRSLAAGDPSKHAGGHRPLLRLGHVSRWSTEAKWGARRRRRWRRVLYVTGDYCLVHTESDARWWTAGVRAASKHRALGRPSNEQRGLWPQPKSRNTTYTDSFCDISTTTI